MTSCFSSPFLCSSTKTFLRVILPDSSHPTSSQTAVSRPQLVGLQPLHTTAAPRPAPSSAVERDSGARPPPHLPSSLGAARARPPSPASGVALPAPYGCPPIFAVAFPKAWFSDTFVFYSYAIPLGDRIQPVASDFNLMLMNPK